MSASTAVLVAGAVLVAACLAWGWYEAGWVRLKVLELQVPGLPPALDGLRVAHLSDFHLGPWSRGRLATERGVAWVAERKPDLVCVTGDLVSHPRGEELFRTLLRRLGRPFVVLGNHDVALTRDPFSRAAELEDLEAEAVLLRDEATAVERRGCTIQLVGVDARSYPRGEARPWELVDREAALRILLCHFPRIALRLPEGDFQLVLAGHMHAGQIVLPLPRGRLTLAHPGARFVVGVYPAAGGVMHVSPGLGTTFVPFRFFARPEATELVLRAAPRIES
ncbi:MAG TPA: metallophosphoesterase [Gaiella sp.]